MKLRNIDATAQRIAEQESPGMWQDYYKEVRRFSQVYEYFNDFYTWVADEFTVTEVGTGLQKMANARNGVLSLITSGTENDGNNLQLGGSADDETLGLSFIPAAGKNLWFECLVAADAWTQHEIFVGLHSQDTSAAESRGTDYIGFTTRDGNAYIDAECAASSVTSNNTNLISVTDGVTNFVKLGFKVTGLDKVEYYVNDVLKCTVVSNIPTVGLKLTISHTTGEAVLKTFNIDYVVAAQDR